MALTEVCLYLRNWFDKDRYFGTFRISGGSLTENRYLTDEYNSPLVFPDDVRLIIEHTDNIIDYEAHLQEGQYFRIIGSVFNDGVYQFPVTGLTDEIFDGAIWAMAVPPAVLEICKEIDEWSDKYAAIAASPFSVESVTSSSYSRTKANTDSMGGLTWQRAFGSRLARWRKIDGSL